MTNQQTPEVARSTRARIALAAGVISVVAVPLMTIGRYAGFWSPVNVLPSGVAVLVMVVGGLIAIVLGLIGILRRKGRPWSAQPVRSSLVGLVLGLAMIGNLVATAVTGAKYPPIHDVTTDTENPPAFVVLQAERDAMNAPNTTQYNPKVAPLQKEGFPNLGPKVLAAPAPEAFNRALEAAKGMGWRIAASAPTDGRIEAVATTFWAGYIDDVVIRVTPVSETQTRIDARSVSRVGGGDIGANGKRIEKFLASLH